MNTEHREHGAHAGREPKPLPASTRAERPQSLAKRVTLATALATAASGALAALIAGVSARTLLERQEDQTIVRAAIELADEVRDDVEDLDDLDEEYASYRGNEPPSLSLILRHELEDVKLPSARAALFVGDARVAGEPELPRLAHQRCTNLSSALPLRACGTEYGETGSLTLAVSAESDRAQRTVMLQATLLGLLLGALFGGVASGIAARWAIEPLVELCARVRQVRVDAPNAEPLAPVLPFAELEELRAAIALLVERLGASLSTAQAFSAEAAHELRTPLATIAGELELLAEAPSQASPELVSALQREVHELSALVQRLLVLSRSDRAALAHAEAVDLADIADELARELPPANRARVQLELADDLVVRGDFALLKAMLGNALDNALKFTRGAVRVHSQRDGASALLDVIDDGLGIPSRERERVFSAFYRAAWTRAEGTPGHGIGLALIAHVAAAHGGSAEFVERARGAQLRVRLPLWSPQA